MITAFHVLAGSLALLGGAIALSSRKGGAWHRRSGTVFCGVMLAMGVSGSVLAALHAKPLSLFSGLLVCYLVATGWLTVRLPLHAQRGWLMLGAAAAACIGGALWALAAGGWARPASDAGPSVVFGTVAMLAAVLDVRLLRVGQIDGRHRLMRHLWRLGFAMWMVTTAFFLGQAQLFTPALRKIELLALPVLAVLGATLLFAARTWLQGRKKSVA